MNLKQVQARILPSCKAKEYGDVRSMLDEWVTMPTHGMQCQMIRFLIVNCKGAYFSYCPLDGWGYDEDDDTNINR